MSFRSLSALLLLLSFAQAQESPADAQLKNGLALAQSKHWDEAKQVFLQGQESNPFDKRFPVELAGLAFQAKDNPAAIHYLRRAVHLDPTDEYANNFLASLYLLEGNLDAAVKYWNRVGKPRIDQIRFEPQLRTNPILLDRSFAFSPASTLRFDDLKTSEATLQSLQVFSTPQYALQAKPSGDFDFVVRASEKNGFGSSKLQALIRIFRGLPYATIYPEYDNIGSEARSLTSLLRWDSNKRRAAVQFAAPLKHRPSIRYRFSADFRDENWLLSPTTANSFGFHSRHYSFGAAIGQTVSGKWNWNVSTQLTHEGAPQLTAPELFNDGFSLKYLAAIERQLFYVPEHRFSITAKLTPQFGRNFRTPSSAFAQVRGDTELQWLPGRKSGDYEFRTNFSAARSWGTLPFSELFMLGTERDNDLLLRGHVGTRDGRKGSAPLARDYLLGNFEFNRRVFNDGVFDVKLGPFVDIARPYHTLQVQQDERWLYDPGVSLKISVLGAATVTLSYARNLRDHGNAFYVTALQ